MGIDGWGLIDEAFWLFEFFFFMMLSISLVCYFIQLEREQELERQQQVERQKLNNSNMIVVFFLLRRDVCGVECQFGL